MESRLVAHLQRLNGWRLWLLFSLAAVLAALLIVSLMDLALMGRITPDYLLTGLVAAGIVAPVSLLLLSTLLREVARQGQEALSRSAESAEARLRTALESADEGILMVSTDGTVLSANTRFWELWGLAQTTPPAARDEQLWPQMAAQLADPSGFLEGVHRLQGSDAQVVDTLRCRDGRVVERYTRALHSGVEQGRIWCFRDVSAQARTSLALAEREEQYRAIVNQAAEGIELVDAQTLCFLEVNDAACRMLGHDRDDLVGRDWAATDASFDAPGLRGIVATALDQGEVRFDGRRRRKDGRCIEVTASLRALRLRGRTCLVGVWHDIGERKATDQALRESRALLQAIIDAAPMRVFWKDRDLRYLGCNPAFARDAGRASPQEVIGRTDTELAWADQAAIYQADDRAVMASGVAKLGYEEPQTTPDGRTIWLDTSKVPLTDRDGRNIGVLGIYQDITDRKRLNDTLRRREQYQRAVLDNFPFMVWLKDEAGRFLAVNRVFAAKFGRASADELIGRTDLDIAPADLARGYREDDQAVMRSGQPRQVEELIDVGGQRVWFETYKSPVSLDGRAVGTVGFSRDISARRQNAAELERHRLHLEELVQQRTSALLATEARAARILDSAADGLYGVDREGRITFINAAACRLLGHRSEQVMGRPAHALFHHRRGDGSPSPAADSALLQAWRDGRECRLDDETCWHADGHPVPVTLASHPIIEDGDIVGAVVSVVDVSQQRAAMQARERALSEAEALARARSQFLANMSHEIRTPMNGVLGFARIGLRRCDDPAQVRQAFEKILTSGNLLLGVVNEILDFSKIDAGKLHVEATEMSIGKVLDDAVQLVADRARAKGLDLRLDKAEDLPSTCLGDPLRLGQVLLNLLSNAVKFTEQGSVRLSARREDGQLVFRVEDTGIGMSAEQLAQVFDPFQQADGSTTRRFGGTGLGLAICKGLLELMRGEIRVDSVPGVGSRFEVRLPYLAPRHPSAAAAPAAAAALPERPLAGLSILVAEDNPINQTVLASVLAHDGARVVVVGDGAAAVERVTHDGATAYDVVLMDIQMPVMDGFEAARRLRLVAPDLPIIGQTAHAFNEDRERCLAAGMVGHLAKPIDPEALVRLVRQVLGVRRPPA